MSKAIFFFSYTVPCQEYSIEEPQALNDSLNGSLINSGFAVPQQPMNSFNQPIIHLHSTPESNPIRNKSKGSMQGENMVCTCMANEKTIV